MSVTICCLLYGNYPKLANRCLKPISELYKHGIEVRLGCNEVSAETKQIIKELLPPSERLTIIDHSPQVYKYPMMRELFNVKPISSDKVMWFDDDSYITDQSPVSWLKSVESFMADERADMVGAVYYLPSSKSQKEWRRLHCSWFKPDMHSHVASFATGGWWTVKASIISKYDWPHPMLRHRGGDVLFGELIRHEGLRLVKYRKGVAINADDSGKESASPRRGYDEPPIGWR